MSGKQGARHWSTALEKLRGIYLEHPRAAMTANYAAMRLGISIFYARKCFMRLRHEGLVQTHTPVRGHTVYRGRAAA